MDDIKKTLEALLGGPIDKYQTVTIGGHTFQLHKNMTEDDWKRLFWHKPGLEEYIKKVTK